MTTLRERERAPRLVASMPGEPPGRGAAVRARPPATTHPGWWTTEGHLIAEHAARTAPEVRNHANLIWGVAELLRGDYKQADYGKVILPLVVMRRLDQVMEPTRDAVIERGAQLEAQGVENVELALRSVAKLQLRFSTTRTSACAPGSSSSGRSTTAIAVARASEATRGLAQRPPS
jgi:hypothetical protein